VLHAVFDDVSARPLDHSARDRVTRSPRKIGPSCALPHAAPRFSGLRISYFSASAPDHLWPVHFSASLIYGAPWCVSWNGSALWELAEHAASALASPLLAALPERVFRPGPLTGVLIRRPSTLYPPFPSTLVKQIVSRGVIDAPTNSPQPKVAARA
jgi:hypothetical protein